MEIRTLRYFLAVAREENMTRAAEQLHVTQPTLSKALKALEDEQAWNLLVSRVIIRRNGCVEFVFRGEITITVRAA